MSFPAAFLGSLTVTGDPVTGPGAPNVLLSGMPAACVGDVVSGATVVGAISMGSMTVLVGGRPAARATSMVTGVNAVSGVPLTTTIAAGNPTVLIGG